MAVELALGPVIHPCLIEINKRNGWQPCSSNNHRHQPPGVPFREIPVLVDLEHPNLEHLGRLVIVGPIRPRQRREVRSFRPAPNL